MWRRATTRGSTGTHRSRRLACTWRWRCRARNGSRAVPQYLALWASLVAVVVLARRLGLSRPAATYAGLVFTTLPVVFLHGGAILNDLLVASFLLAAAVFLTGRAMSDLAVGSVALALALSTKFNAVLALPLVLAVVLAGVPRDRRGRTAVAFGVGVILGSPWYVLNLVKTGSFDGDLGETTGQVTDHSFRTVIGSLRALTFDVVDTSGLWRSEMYIAVGLGAALVGAGLIRRLRGRAGAGVLALAGLVTALTPLILRSLPRPARFLWEEAWSAVGRDDIAHDHPTAWDVLSVPDTSLSWYGAVGAIVILGGVVAAFVAVRRGDLGRRALLFASAPLILVATFALTIIYDPWRGRLLIFGVGLACAAWGWTYRIRWLSVGIAALGVTTLTLSLVHSFTKPSGIRLLEPAISRSVWHRDRIDTLTVIRTYDATSGLLRAVESLVPQDDSMAVATPVDVFLAPLAGPHLSRTLRLVKDGATVPADVGWVVTRPSARVLGCPGAWKTVFSEDAYHWRVLQRVARDDLRSGVRLALAATLRPGLSTRPRNRHRRRTLALRRHKDRSSRPPAAQAQPNRSSSRPAGRHVPGEQHLVAGRDHAEVDVRRGAFVRGRVRALEAEPAAAVGQDGAARGADVPPLRVRLPELDPRAANRLAAQGREDDAGENVPLPDARPYRRRAAAERAEPVGDRRHAPGRRGSRRGGEERADADDAAKAAQPSQRMGWSYRCGRRVGCASVAAVGRAPPLPVGSHYPQRGHRVTIGTMPAAADVDDRLGDG